MRDALQIRLAVVEIPGKDIADTAANLELNTVKELVLLGQSLDVFSEVQDGLKTLRRLGPLVLWTMSKWRLLQYAVCHL